MEKKKRPITGAQIKAVSKYESANYDKTLLRMPKGTLQEIKSAAEHAGESMNGYIVSAVKMRMGGHVRKSLSEGEKDD